MSVVLAESERQAAHLRSLLRVVGDRLSSEMHRAAEAQRRAQQAEAREASTIARLTAVEAAQHQAEHDALKWKEDSKRCEQAMESAERQVRCAKADMRTLERQRYEAKEEASRNREEATRHQFALKDYQAREEGREQGHRLAIQKWFDEGKDEGWEAGHEEGYEEGYGEGRSRGYNEGFKAGRNQGFQSGREQGREEERQNALDAFDKFLAEEMNGHTDNVSLYQVLLDWKELAEDPSFLVGTSYKAVAGDNPMTHTIGGIAGASPAKSCVSEQTMWAALVI
jgi:hypothetical protein